MTHILQTLPLTQTQKQIWMGQKVDPDVPLYNMAMAFYLSGKIDINIFSVAFDLLIKNSDAMRMIIVENDAIPKVAVQDSVSEKLEYIDFSNKENPKLAAKNWLFIHKNTNFDLQKYLFKSALLKISESEFIWFFCQHHLITDGFAMVVAQEKMAEYYQTFSNFEDAKTDLLPMFSDYILYENSLKTTPKFERAKTHWQNKTYSNTSLNLYGKNPAELSATTRRIVSNLTKQQTNALKAIAQEAPFKSFTDDLSLFNVMTTLYLAFLHRISGEYEIALGTPAHNRSTRTFKNTIGVFIELSQLVVNFDKNETFESLGKKLVTENLSFLTNALPGVSEFQNGNFNAVLNFINTQFTEDFAGIPFQTEWLHPDSGDRKHSIRLQVHDLDRRGHLQLHFDVNTMVLDEYLQNRIAVDFDRFVNTFLQKLDQPIANTNLLSENEFKKYVSDFNQTKVVREKLCILDLFEKQVKSNPNATAVSNNNQSLTYAELDLAAKQLADRLQQIGVSNGDLIPICMKRSISFIISVIATQKANCAFLPIDTQLPKNRIDFLINDSRSDLLLSDDIYSTDLFVNNEIMTFSNIKINISSKKEVSKNNSINKNLAYVIYTSGSTGEPKGVMISQAAIVNYLLWAQQNYNFQPEMSMPLFSGIAADLTLTSILLPLISGGTIRLYDTPESGVDAAIFDVLNENCVDIIKLTPTHLSIALDEFKNASRIKCMIIGGENLLSHLANAAQIALGKSAKIYNEYGPTEATIGCMIHLFNSEADQTSAVPIGKPIDNMQIHVLDKFGKPVPANVDGEIFISGIGLAEGYWQKELLTTEKFIKLPYTNQLAYATGDLAKRLDNGNLLFLGRNDEQLKIRGYRIEPTEVEAAIKQFENVKSVFVTAVSKNNAAQQSEITYCAKCGLASNHPEAAIDDAKICKICREFEQQKDLARSYFKTLNDLKVIVNEAKTSQNGEYDSIMLYSGGKDSTYVLYQIVKMGLRPLVFSLANGYISEKAKANIRRVVADLGLDLHWGSTPAMNAIFTDSLKRFSNVCNGCFKAIYTLAVNLAIEKNIRYIFTGLSRGQFFETRISELFKSNIFKPEEIDYNIIEARKAYHRMDDAVSQQMDVSAFQKDDIFETVQFVDFFRYSNVSLAEMYEFLDAHVPWIRPDDTGRSTNCLINDAGIFVHKAERGFHNYALPYSWDVRLGHKERDAALAELDDELDKKRVYKMLDEIGYLPYFQNASTKQLVAYFTADCKIDIEKLREKLSKQLPAYMLPAHFVQLDAFPKNLTGKINSKALPNPINGEATSKAAFVEATTENERILKDIWEQILSIPSIGINDNFFSLGGDSIQNIQIVAQANKRNLRITPAQLFQHPTIAELAAVAVKKELKRIEKTIKKPLINLSKKHNDKLSSLLKKADQKSKK